MQSTEASQQPAAPSPANPRAPDEGRRVTKEEYWAKWYQTPYPHIDVSYEWINGILQAKPPSNYPQIKQYRWFFSLISLYIETHPIADLINLNCGVSMTVPDASQPSGKWDVVYKPDLAVIRHDNPAPWGADDQYAFEGVCDICVEEISDAALEEVHRDTREKKRGYAVAGVKEYYILDPEDRYMRFYRLTAGRRYEEMQPDAAGTIRSNVLPGFRFRRADLLKQPPLAELALDEIYAGYVFPGYLDAVKRLAAATAARKQAEDRAAAATEARKQAEQQAAEAAARRQAEERATAEAAARRQAEERTQQAEQRAAAEAAARRQAEERTQQAEQRAAAEAAARRQAEEDNRALQAELARLRQQSS